MKWKEKVSKGLGRNRDHQGWGGECYILGKRFYKLYQGLSRRVEKSSLWLDILVGIIDRICWRKIQTEKSKNFHPSCLSRCNEPGCHSTATSMLEAHGCH